jgi:glucan endo-1,6-beta-glucosidase
MDVNWQANTSQRANPADAAIGPQAYDNHLYYSYVNLHYLLYHG